MLEPQSTSDVYAKLCDIVDGLPVGAAFSADHPDVQALIDAGQVSPQVLGTCFAALHRRGLIVHTGWHPMTHGSRNGGSAHTWEVAA